MNLIQFLDRHIHSGLMNDELLYTRARIITAFILLSMGF